MLPDDLRWQIDGYARLSSARDVLEVLLQGRWAPTPALVGAVADLVESAERRFGWAEQVAA